MSRLAGRAWWRIPGALLVAAAVLGLGAAQPAWAVTATGGDITNEVGGYKIHIFTNTAATAALTVGSAGEVEVLVVAGGGGGGHMSNGGGGGGGAGGLIYSSAYAVAVGAISVSIGTGGVGGITSGASGGNGGNSVFGSITAIGGGGGGHGNYGNGRNGGSGGGAGYASGIYGTGIAGQGSNGGWRAGGDHGAGGGGASSVGSNSTASGPGRGGEGASYSLSGSSVTYAGGGGGGGYNSTGGSGGSGGGGGGASPNGVNGLGGGGGGGRAASGASGGNGGSGIVIVRYSAGQALVENRAPGTVGSDSAEMIGYLSSTGATPTTVFVHWGVTDGRDAVANWQTNVSLGQCLQGATFTNLATGLDSGTRYYYRCSASNEAGVTWAGSSTNLVTSNAPGSKLYGEGGDLTNDLPGYRVHIFTNPAAAATFRVRGASGTVDAFLVAGGGGGGHMSYGGGGGGGGGGLLYSGGYAVVCEPITVTVGAGGAGSAVNGVSGANGSNSVFGSLVAYGGGGGGHGNYAAGKVGGSGGGAGYGSGTLGGSATGSQGYAGGNYGAGGGGSGGGGASHAGYSSPAGNLGGNGGAGLASTITGSSVIYAGGGAGGGYNDVGGTGGAGGGGGSTSADGTNGLGGGGCGGRAVSGSAGANGGSGVVIVRYAYEPRPAITNLPALVNGTTASMCGYLTSTGMSVTKVWVFWGATDRADQKGLWDTNAYLGVRLEGEFLTNTASGLTPGAQYFYRFLASNDAGEAWAAPTTNFLITGGCAVDNGDGADNVGLTSATLNGEVTAGSPIPKAYVCWGTADGGGADTGAWEHVEDMGPRFGAFSTNVSGLLANQAYYYRCYVTNDNGSGWAEASVCFTTEMPVVSIGSISATEGAGPQLVSFPVTLSAACGPGVSVDFASADSTALAGSDYTATNGTLYIAPGASAGTVAVELLGDSTDEGFAESFTVTLSNPSGATLGTSAGACVVTDDDVVAQTQTWVGGSGLWSVSTNWDHGGPGAGDAVVINSGSVLLTNDTAQLASLAMGGGALVVSNWSTRVRAGAVSLTAGTITLPAAFTNEAARNRVWIECTDFTLGSGAAINVDGKGWSGKVYGATSTRGFGPGAGLDNRYAAGHGGYGRAGGYSWEFGTMPYGSVSEPADPGSGGGGYAGNYGGGNGGGAVRIDATGDVIVDGTIAASATDAAGGSGGSGGGVHITCNTIQGAGIVRANGSLGNGGANQGGGGGRIAVSYNSGSQAAVAVPAISYSCAGGGSAACDPGDIGTLHFTDERFLQRAPLTGLTGQWYSASSELAFPALTVSNAWLRFVGDGVSLTVANAMLLTTGARIEVGGNITYSNFYWDLLPNAYGKTPRPVSEMTRNPSVSCMNLSLVDGGALWVYAGRTNASAEAGALVEVSGALTIASNSWLYPVNHGTNGGHVLLRVGGMNLQPGGGINAVGLGYGNPDNRSANVKGYGPGGGFYLINGIGAGYGGTGGNAQSTYGQTYGTSNVPPFSCGSGGGGYQGSGYHPSAGGGLVCIDATWADVTVNGTIKADGGSATAGCGAGSGGGVYLLCQGLAGSGRIQAEGGIGRPGASQLGGGGGGRIAVFRRPAKDTFTGVGTYSVPAGTNYVNFIGEPGTVYLGESPEPPTEAGIMIHLW